MKFRTKNVFRTQKINFQVRNSTNFNLGVVCARLRDHAPRRRRRGRQGYERDFGTCIFSFFFLKIHTIFYNILFKTIKIA